MGMPTVSQQPYWTASVVRALPDDGKRYECIDGELLVTPVPSLQHQDVVGVLLVRLHAWIQQERVGKVMFSPADIEIVPGTLVQPDLFVVPRDAQGTLPREWHEVRTLLLAVEVLSPSTARHDRVTKREFYMRAGVGEYWIVDTDACLVERWTPADTRPEIIGEDATLEWNPPGASAPFTLALGPFFAAIAAEYPES